MGGICLVLSSKDIYGTKQHFYGLNDLAHDFSNVIQKPAAEFIDLNLENEDAFDREASGVYKLIPYYVKIYPNDNHQDRFIIHQNPFNGEFQLVKIFDYINRKKVRALFHPYKEILQKKDKSTINSLQKYQTNVKALAEKNEKLNIEIQETKEKAKYFKENLQRKEKKFEEKIKNEDERIKQKELKIDEDLIQLELKNKENEQKIYNLQQELESRQSTIDEQKIMIEKLEPELSKLRYENVWLKEKNLILTNQVEITNENLNQEKDKNKKFEKQEKEFKEMKKTNERMQKTNDHLSKFSQFEEKWKESDVYKKESEVYKKQLEVYKKQLETIQSYFENFYYTYKKNFAQNFMKLLPLNQIRLIEFFKNEQLEYAPFAYEHFLVSYAIFKQAEHFRIGEMIYIPSKEVFDPKTLKFPPIIWNGNTYNL